MKYPGVNPYTRVDPYPDPTRGHGYMGGYGYGYGYRYPGVYPRHSLPVVHHLRE
jgi:hypothetical protein